MSATSSAEASRPPSSAAAPSLTEWSGPRARPWPWVRDFALVGGVTGFAAPFFVVRSVEYSLAAGFGGAIAGAGLGAFTAALLAGRARRWPRALFVPLGLALGAGWGGVAGLATGLLGVGPGVLGVSIAVAALAGAAQLGWFWLAYCHRRVNRRSTAPVVALASVLASALGWPAALTFLALLT